MKILRLVLADDHEVLRAGLKLLLSSQADMRVVAEAGNGEETLQMARRFKPNVVIMDLSMPGMNGLKATELLRVELPETKILVLTSHEDESYFRQMCHANASGYVLKRSAGVELLQAIRKVASGQMHFDQGLTNRTLIRQASRSADGRGSVEHLTEREEQVLRRVALGYTNKEIANQLEISVKTVETHKVRICEKFNFLSRADMVQYALRQGWLDPTRSFAPASL